MDRLPIEPNIEAGNSFMFSLKARLRDVAKAFNPVSDWVTQAASYFNFSNGQFVLKDGTVNAPGLAWASEPGLGWYRPSPGFIAMASGGGIAGYFNFNGATSAAMALIPRALGTSAVYLQNNSGANYNLLNVSQGSNGNAAIQTAVGGTATRGNLTLDAPVVNISSRMAFVGANDGWYGLNVVNGITNSVAWAFTSGGLIGLRVDATANFGTINTTAVSDIRLKKDIQPFEQGLDAVLALEPIQYEYDHSIREHLPKGRCHGFSAQAMQQIVPRAVIDMGDELHLDTRELIPVLVNAVKTIDARLRALEAARAAKPSS